MNLDKTYENETRWFNYCIDSDPQEIKSHITETYITSNKKRIHLDVYDSPESRVKAGIIFIHGTAVYSRFYTEFLYQLYKKGYQVIAPDLPGHGLSEGRRGHFDMELLSNAVYDVTSHMLDNYAKKVVVMGSSLGGITTLYAVANDDRIAAGVCHNVAIFNEGAYKRIVHVSGIVNLLKPLVPYFAKILPTLRLSVWRYLPIDNLVQDQALLERVNILLEDEILASKYTLKSLATQMRAPLARPIEEITTPIMIINGTNDVLFSLEYMQEIYERLQSSRNKRLEIIPDSSHLILHERREECLSRITSWLDVTL